MRLKGYIIRVGLFGITKADMRDAGRAAMRLAGWMWHRRYKGFHFQSFAGAKYGYAQRAPRYKNSRFAFGKQRTAGPPRPLVFTGESERLAMASNKVVARATAFDRYHADVIVNAPALNYRNKNSTIDMRKEMTTLLPAESKQLEAEFARGFIGHITQRIATKRATRRLAG